MDEWIQIKTSIHVPLHSGVDEKYVFFCVDRRAGRGGGGDTYPGPGDKDKRKSLARNSHQEFVRAWHWSLGWYGGWRNSPHRLNGSDATSEGAWRGGKAHLSRIGSVALTSKLFSWLTSSRPFLPGTFSNPGVSSQGDLDAPGKSKPSNFLHLHPRTKNGLHPGCRSRCRQGESHTRGRILFTTSSNMALCFQKVSFSLFLSLKFEGSGHYHSTIAGSCT